MMIKIGIFFIGLSLFLAFYQSQIWAGHYLTSFTYEIFSIYPVWLLGLIFILIGYFLKFKSDEVAREFRERTNFTKKDEDKLK